MLLLCLYFVLKKKKNINPDDRDVLLSLHDLLYQNQQEKGQSLVLIPSLPQPVNFWAK